MLCCLTAALFGLWLTGCRGRQEGGSILPEGVTLAMNDGLPDVWLDDASIAGQTCERGHEEGNGGHFPLPCHAGGILQEG